MLYRTPRAAVWAVCAAFALSILSCSSSSSSSTSSSDSPSPIEPFATADLVVAPVATEAVVLLPDGTAVSAAAGQLLVQLEESLEAEDWTAIQNYLETVGAEAIGQNPLLRSVTYSITERATLEQAMVDLVSLSGVEHAGPNLKVETATSVPVNEFADTIGQEWTSTLRAAEAWAVTTGSDQTIIGMVDSGYDPTSGHVALNRLLAVDSGSLLDNTGHGTRVASLIGASGIDLSCSTGVDWQSTLVVANGFNETGGYLTEVRADLVRTAERGARVINLSLVASVPAGSNEQTTQRIVHAYREGLIGAARWAARDNVLLVIAAGNDALAADDQLFSTSRPEAEARWADHCVLVGALDRNGSPATFANRGAVVDVYAPGDAVSTGDLNGLCELRSGSSLSAALVTGALGLISAELPLMDALQLKQILLDTRGATRELQLLEAVLNAGRVDEQPVEILDLNDVDRPITVVNASTLTESLDLLLLVDRSSAANESLATLGETAGSMLTALREDFPDLRVSLASFSDFPVSPFGLENDSPFTLHQPLTYVDSDVVNQIVTLSTLDVTDGQGSHYEALVRATDELVFEPSPLIGWQKERAKSILLLSSTGFHDPNATTGYPGASFDEAVRQLLDSDVTLVGIGSGLDASAELQLRTLVQAVDGQSMVLDNLSTGLVNAVRTQTRATWIEARAQLGAPLGTLPISGVAPSNLTVRANSNSQVTVSVEPAVPSFFKQTQTGRVLLTTPLGTVLQRIHLQRDIPGVVDF